MIYKFIYTFELPTTNKIIDTNRKNPFAGANQKKKFTELISMVSRSQCKEKITKKVDITCRWYCKDKRTDKDNITGGLKFVLDGLQDAGILKNDGWKEIGNIYHFFKVDKKNPGLELELKEVEEKNER